MTIMLLGTDKVRLSKADLQKLQERAAKNGYTIGTPETVAEVRDAIICGMSDDAVERLLEQLDSEIGVSGNSDTPVHAGAMKSRPDSQD